MKVTIGIDPGQSGAIAVLVDGAFASFADMPLVPRKAGGFQVSAAQLAAVLRGIQQRYSNAGAIVELNPGEHAIYRSACAPIPQITAVLEQVSAMPGQGVSGMFRFGEAFGVVQGVLGSLGIPTLFVAPVRWKKWAGLIGTEKDVARTVAIQRFPAAATQLARKKDSGRADALLIAAWGDSAQPSALAA